MIVCGFIAKTSRNLTLLSSHRGMWLDCMWLYCQDIEEFDFIVKSSRNVALLSSHRRMWFYYRKGFTEERCSGGLQFAFADMQLFCPCTRDIRKNNLKVFTFAIPDTPSLTQGCTLLVGPCLQKVFFKTNRACKSRSLNVIVRGTRVT